MSYNRLQRAEGVSAWGGVSEGLAGLLGGSGGPPGRQSNLFWPKSVPGVNLCDPPL